MLCELCTQEKRKKVSKGTRVRCTQSLWVGRVRQIKQFCQQIDFMKKETKVQSLVSTCLLKGLNSKQAGTTQQEKKQLSCFTQHKRYQSTRFSKLYSKGFVQDFYLKKGFSCQNTHHFPKINKLVVNKSSKEFVRDRLEILPSFLSLLFVTNQKSEPRLALKSIAGFKLREKQIIGCKVTLRKFKSLELLERVTQLVLPLSRDFSGISATSFDFYGNLTIGCKESLLFPELSENFEFFERVGGFDLCLSISPINPVQSNPVPNSTAFERFTNLVCKATTKADKRQTKENLFLNTIGDPSNTSFRGHVFNSNSKESALLCTGMQLPLS